MILVPAMKLCSINDLWVDNETVFINNFLVSYEPYALMISASVEKLCYVDDFWVESDSDFMNNS